MSEILEENALAGTLEYKPSFERDERQKTGWITDAGAAITENLQLSKPGNQIGTGLVTNTIVTFEESKAVLLKRLAELEAEFRKISFSIEEKFRLDIAKAKEVLDLPPGELTFLDYKMALDAIATPAGEFLVEIIEDQIEGVDGNIRLELYADYFELKKDYLLIEDYLQRICVPALSIQEIPFEEKDWEKELLQNEQEWNKRSMTATSAKDNSYAVYKNAILYNPELVMAKKDLLHKTTKEQSLYANQGAQLTDSLTLIRSKTRDFQGTFAFLEESMEHERYEDGQEVLDSLLFLTEDNKIWEENLTNFGLMLTLSVDVRNDEKHHMKTSLRGIYSPDNQKKIIDELAVHNAVFQSTTLPALHAMNSYQETQSAIMNALLNEAAIGLKENNVQKKQKTKEIYTVTRATSLLRMKKIEETLKKEDARQGYQLMEAIKKQTALKGIPSAGATANFLAE